VSGWNAAPISSLVRSDHKAKPLAEEAAVWNLNLDQIESNSGRILKKVYSSANDLGTSTYFFEPRTLLYSKLRPYLNKVVVADEAGVATTELVPIRCNPDIVMPEYLAYFLRSPEFLKFATTLVAGAKMPRMVMSEFWKYEVPLPPLSEQICIAEILDQADALRVKRREALAQLDSLTQSIFIEMFERNTHFESTTLGAVSSLRRGPFGGALKKEIFVEDGPMVYEQRNAIYNDCMTGRYFITEAKYRDMEDFAVVPADIIVSCSGTLGQVAIVPEGAPKGVINQALLRVRVDKEKVTSLYIKHALQSSGIQNQLLRLSHGTGLQNFPPMSEVKSLELHQPPLALQYEFEKCVGALEKQQSNFRRSLVELDALFASPPTPRL